MVKTESNKQKQKQGKTYAKETKTEPNKIKSKRSTRQTEEPQNKIKQLESELRKTQNLKTKPK